MRTELKVTWLKVVLFILWLVWLGIVAVTGPPQTLLGTVGLVLFSALIFVAAYWFHAVILRAVARMMRGSPRD